MHMGLQRSGSHSHITHLSVISFNPPSNIEQGISIKSVIYSDSSSF